MTAETLWFRHREGGSLHEVEKGSEAHRRCLSERTVVDEEAGDVPEPVFERISVSEVKKAHDNPEKVPGFREQVKRGPRRGTTLVVQQAAEAAGPSEDEIQARVDAAAKAAAEAAVEKFAQDLSELDEASAGAAKTTNPKG